MPIKLCLVRLAKRANRHANNDPVDSLSLAGVTGDSHSLIAMKSGGVANYLTFVGYDKTGGSPFRLDCTRSSFALE
jgi:hypothetical protein